MTINISKVNTHRGKYVRPGTFESVGVCDRSGFLFNSSDLCKQMEYRGNSLVWTGLLVGRPFLDIPDAQNRIVLPKKDPTPVKNPRPRNNNETEYLADDLNSVEAEQLLNTIDFVTCELVEDLPVKAGEDISNKTSKELLTILHQISWRQDD